VTTPLELVKLSRLMECTSGRREVVVGLLDGPVAVDHPELAKNNIRALPRGGGCVTPSSPACRHGAFVAGILAGRRGGAAPAICPDCTLPVRAIFAETAGERQQPPSATSPQVWPRRLASVLTRTRGC
jgi:hypothetical protein